MQIRAAVEDDINALAQLWHLGWHSAHAAVVDTDLVRLRDPENFMGRAKTYLNHMRVAVLDGAIVGLFVVHGDELVQFYVGLDHHGKGIGPAMLVEAETLLQGRVAWLTCAVGNNRATAFYEKCGWRNVGETVKIFETLEGPKAVNVFRFEKAL